MIPLLILGMTSWGMTSGGLTSRPAAAPQQKPAATSSARPAPATPAPAATAAAKASQSAAEKALKLGSPDALALYHKALFDNPRWDYGWWTLGTIEYGVQHFPECRDAFKRLVRLTPKVGAASTMLGLCEFGAHQEGDALTHLRAGQELGTGSPDIDKVAKYQLATLFIKRGAFETALAILAQLSQSTEEQPAYFRLTGVAALWKPMLPEDVAESDRELVYLTGRAFWLASAGKAAQADEAMQDLLARYPSATGVHYLYGSFELGNNPDRALEEFRAELKINPSHPGAISALAAEYLRRGDAVNGLPYARQLVTLMPDALASHALLGRLLAEQGDVQEGVRELEKARSIDPLHPQPHIVLASLYAKLGRKEDAARERQEFLRLRDKDNKDKETHAPER